MIARGRHPLWLVIVEQVLAFAFILGLSLLIIHVVAPIVYVLAGFLILIAIAALILGLLGVFDAAMEGLAGLAGAGLHALEMVFGAVSMARWGGLAGVAASLLWALLWYTALNPTLRTEKRLDAIAAALTHYTAVGNPFPPHGIEQSLDIGGADPYHLRRYQDRATGRLIDAWGRTIHYKTNGQTFNLWSNGRDGLNSTRDDVAIIHFQSPRPVTQADAAPTKQLPGAARDAAREAAEELAKRATDALKERLADLKDQAADTEADEAAPDPAAGEDPTTEPPPPS